MNNDLVSIIMPSYNCGKYVEQTIRSVQAQTYTNWEIIFMDDCSTDDTIRRVSELQEKDSRIHLFQNSCNSGAAVSRNNALRESKGRWIAFLDSDDQWEPTKLEKQVRFMEENGYSFSYTEYQEMDSEGVLTGVVITGPKHVTKRGMYHFCWPGCLTVMYDASVVGLMQIEDIKKNNDYAMWLQVIKKADCHLLPESTAYYRRHSGSISSHSYLTMTMWHYRLFRDAMQLSAPYSVFCTLRNLIFGTLKKIVYVKHYTVR